MPSSKLCTDTDARSENLFKIQAEWQVFGSSDKDSYEILIRIHPVK